MGESYSCASGGVIVAGRRRYAFDSVAIASDDGNGPYATAGQNIVISLHGSGGSDTTTGRQYRAACSGQLAHGDQTQFKFSTLRDYDPLITLVRPVDTIGTTTQGIRQTQWMGFIDDVPTGMLLFTEHRLDALLVWLEANITNVNHAKRVLGGGSMGGWGTLSYGIRRVNKFAALYPDRPRWRYGYVIGEIEYQDWATGGHTHTVASSANVATIDGGGPIFAHHDITSYVANTANDIPWIGWNVGRQDGFVNFSDHVDAVVAMRAAKRGFAFAWNNGNHTAGSIQSEIKQSYPYGTFEIGKGYPLFTNHSGDQDPAVDLVGGINIGLSFRNVVETSSGWSCQVTSVLGARTVTVEPISKVFRAAVTPQNVTIPAANTWVSVSFTA